MLKCRVLQCWNGNETTRVIQRRVSMCKEAGTVQSRENVSFLWFSLLGIINTSEAPHHWNMESSHLSTDLQTLLSDLLLASSTLLAVIMSTHSWAAGHLQTDTRKRHCSVLSIFFSSFHTHAHISCWNPGEEQKLFEDSLHEMERGVVALPLRSPGRSQQVLKAKIIFDSASTAVPQLEWMWSTFYEGFYYCQNLRRFSIDVCLVLC